MKMKSGEFITLSACTMMLTALGIDIMLPAFDEVRQYFHLSPQSTAPSKIIVFFFMGQVAQLLFGILSDRFGRLAILRIGFPLYIIGGIAATYAPSLNLMFAARFIAGMGAAAVLMTTIAGVRDRFVGDQMARTMSLIFTIFLFTPILAPFLGIAILSVSSWRSVFLTPPIFAVIIFIWSLRLEESLPPEKRITLKWSNILHSVRTVLGNKIFLRYTAVTTILFMGLSSYVASSEHIIGEIFGRPKLFPWVFAGIGFIMSCCSLLNSRLSTRYGARPTLKWLLIFYTIAASILLLIVFISGESPNLFVFFAGVAVLLGINIAVEPNSSALALEPMGDMAGVASSVYGTSFFFIGSFFGSVISHYMVKSVLPLALAFFIIGMVVVAIVYSDKRNKGV